MNHRIIEKFLNNTCTVEEAREVVEWFATPEGQAHLAKRLDEDAGLLQDERIRPLLPDVDSKQMWQKIREHIYAQKSYNTFHYRRRKAASYGYAAAIILVVGLLSVFFVWKYHPAKQQGAKEWAAHYSASANVQQKIRLGDGTRVRLNSDSQLWLFKDYGQGRREVKLKGEAYFKVRHNAAQPFVIHTHGAVIKDLGTVFDVRALPGEDNVQVAVKSGKVSIRSEQKPQKQAVELTGGHFGYLNLQTDSIAIDAFAVGNYLSWMDNQFTFDNASLKKVSRQLSRIYNVSFTYTSDDLKGMKLSADFKGHSLKKALSVIALTLSIHYQMKDHHVIWSKRK
jgi:ferric-dicitrate binding protein FerR (iron transport regulator)